jgi:hypothetical protein
LIVFESFTASALRSQFDLAAALCAVQKTKTAFQISLREIRWRGIPIAVQQLEARSGKGRAFLLAASFGADSRNFEPLERILHSPPVKPNASARDFYHRNFSGGHKTFDAASFQSEPLGQLIFCQ